MPKQCLKQYQVDIYRIAQTGEGTYHQLPCMRHVDGMCVIAKAPKDAERKARYLKGCKSKVEYEVAVSEVCFHD